jgi:L,D-transpeptidase catalytic domain
MERLIRRSLRMGLYRLARAGVPLFAVAGLFGCDAMLLAEPVEPSRPEPVAAPGEATHAAVGRVPARKSDRGRRGGEASAAQTAEVVSTLRRPPARVPFERAQYHATPPLPGSRTALAWQFDALVFRHPSTTRRPVGVVRRNTRLAVEDWVEGEGCDKSWYALVGGGYVCSGDGFEVNRDPDPLAAPLQVVPPAVDQALPYRYAKVKTPAPLYWRLPTPQELAAGSREPIRERMKGAYFVALDARERVGGEAMSRTVRGFYVRDRDLEERAAATMQGELLAGADALPLAFVYADEAVLVDPDSGAPLGRAERFARFGVQAVRDGEGEGVTPWVVATDGFAVAADRVRLARIRARPVEVGADEQWIHIDLDEQVLVAYEGDRPVLATLVSSGKEGFVPPLGLYRVHKKYTTVTMSGPDPDAGTYAVEEVPWTMYYWGSFALHGAYWHDEFGRVRSHGCTNLPPIDAHWLYHWSTPELPDGWHAAVGIRGPWVWFTRGDEDRALEPALVAASGAPRSAAP